MWDGITYPFLNFNGATFDLVKRVKFGGSGHFPENAWREWPEILHADVSSPPTGLIRLWSRSVDFFIYWHYFDLVKQVNLGGSGHFPEKAWREWHEILYIDVSWLPSELFRSWSTSVRRYLNLAKRVKFEVSGQFGYALHVDFPHYGAPLTQKMVIIRVSGHYLENVWE